MSNILAIHSSLSSENSISNQLVDQTVAALLQSAPHGQVVLRDLAASSIPHLDADALAGIRGEPASEAQASARALSEKLVGELKAADVLVIGAPMYNFGIPTSLKSWFDYVLHPGITFQ
jgi:FMN-dependent NADH-azoreductase